MNRDMEINGEIVNDKVRYADLNLSPELMRAIDKKGYVQATPVQAGAIPYFMEWKDVIAKAPTGTGKTFAFGIPMVEHADPQGTQVTGLVLAPTRELAIQIRDELRDLCAFKEGVRTVCLYGGQPIDKQILQLKKAPQIVVATPGRLMDHVKRRTVRLDKVETVVLDEADRMLDMGFWPAMKKIIGATPSSRQTLLFSATIDQSIQKNLGSLLNDPAIVEIARNGETAKNVEQFMMPIANFKKQELLEAVLEEKGSDRIIVFARTKNRTEDCSEALCDAGYRAESIHSDKSQGQRKRALDNFRRGRTSILVATDVLARGIDVPDVDHVINFDLPDMPEDYVHRIGRTGRAGETGYAISFVSPEAKAQLLDIEKLLGEHIPTLDIDGYDATEAEKALAGQFVPKTTVGSAAFSRSLRRNGAGGFGSSGVSL